MPIPPNPPLMTPEHDAVLCAAFPSLFRLRHASPQESGMGRGFECGDGWYELLLGLCAEVERHAAAAGIDPVVVQVKEKFGELRVYVDGGDDAVERLVDQAVGRSHGICACCGGPGTRRDDSFRSARCAEHEG